jgi:hypothetical protein
MTNVYHGVKSVTVKTITYPGHEEGSTKKHYLELHLEGENGDKQIISLYTLSTNGIPKVYNEREEH